MNDSQVLVWRQVVRDVRFRKALSIGIDREQIVDAAYNGVAQPASQIPADLSSNRAHNLTSETGRHRSALDVHRVSR